MTLDARTLVGAWRRTVASGSPLFGRRVNALPESAGLPGDAGCSAPALEALRAIDMAVQEEARGSSKSRIVVTHPGPRLMLAGTRDVARSLIAAARRELLVVGYTITDDEFSEALRERGLAGVAVTVVGDRDKGGARELVRTWPATARPLDAYEGVEPEDPTKPWIVHGKVIVADRTSALVGSANFTSVGLGRNIEIGVHLEGEAVSEIVCFVARLVHEGWLTKARP